MKLAIADPPYLGRANRYYGDGGGISRGKGRADSHPEAKQWDLIETHHKLIDTLENNYDGWAIALSIHSLSQYLTKIQTDSRNGIRVLSWHKPRSVPSGSRIMTSWEAVIVRIPTERKGRDTGFNCRDTLIANPANVGFMGAKPKEWTFWILDVLGYRQGDQVDDLFNGSGMVAKAIAEYERERNGNQGDKSEASGGEPNSRRSKAS